MGVKGKRLKAGWDNEYLLREYSQFLDAFSLYKNEKINNCIIYINACIQIGCFRSEKTNIYESKR